jgi:hypothetical protein
LAKNKGKILILHLDMKDITNQPSIEESKQECTVDHLETTNPHLMSTQKESYFNPSKKERTKFFFYSLRKLIRRIIWNDLKKKLFFTRTHPKFFSKSCNDVAYRLGPTEISINLNKLGMSKAYSSKEFSAKKETSITHKSLNIDLPSITQEPSYFQNVLPKISSSTTTLESQSMDKAVRPFFANEKSSMMRTLKKETMHTKETVPDSFQTFTLTYDDLQPSKIDRVESSLIHAKNITELEAENTLSDLIENIEIENEKSLIYDHPFLMSLGNHKSGSITGTKETKECTSDAAMRASASGAQGQMDMNLIKLYAERMLRKKLEIKLEEIQNNNINLLLERNAQEIRFEQHQRALCNKGIK